MTQNAPSIEKGNMNEMMNLEKAIQRCKDRCNIALAKDDDCVIKYMYQYQAIAQLDDASFWEVYDEICGWLGLKGRTA